MRGRDAPGPGVRPAKAEALSGPAPDLSPLLTPEPAAAAARAACGCPCGWARSAGAAGARARAAGPGQPGGPAGPRRGAERGRGARRSRWLPAVRDRESLRTQVSPQPQQHKMADTSPRRSRDRALAPPLPGPAPPRLAPPRLPAHPASHDILPFRCLPPFFPDTPLPGPRMSGWRRRGGGPAQAPAGPRAGASCPSLSGAGLVSRVGPGPGSL